MTGEFQRYLRAKRTVDDRALDRRLLEELRTGLAKRAASNEEPVRVLELGAGIGTMVTRCLEWELLPEGPVQYTAVDLSEDSVATLPGYVREWATDRGHGVTGDATLTVEADETRVEIDAVVAEGVEYAQEADVEYDLVVGVALLDLIERTALPSVLGAVADGGLYYFPITFDGGTRFHPTHPADRGVERLYHAHMDKKSGGSSRAGGDALAVLQRQQGVSVDAAGSDWIVKPIDGQYPADEAVVLRHILGTVESAVTEVTGGEFDSLGEWLTRRRQQAADAELIYHTHQLDLFGRVAGVSTGENTGLD